MSLKKNSSEGEYRKYMITFLCLVKGYRKLTAASTLGVLMSMFLWWFKDLIIVSKK